MVDDRGSPRRWLIAVALVAGAAVGGGTCMLLEEMHSISSRAAPNQARRQAALKDRQFRAYLAEPSKWRMLDDFRASRVAYTIELGADLQASVALVDLRGAADSLDVVCHIDSRTPSAVRTEVEWRAWRSSELMEVLGVNGMGDADDAIVSDGVLSLFMHSEAGQVAPKLMMLRQPERWVVLRTDQDDMPNESELVVRGMAPRISGADVSVSEGSVDLGGSASRISVGPTEAGYVLHYWVWHRHNEKIDVLPAGERIRLSSNGSQVDVSAWHLPVWCLRLRVNGAGRSGDGEGR